MKSSVRVYTPPIREVERIARRKRTNYNNIIFSVLYGRYTIVFFDTKLTVVGVFAGFVVLF